MTPVAVAADDPRWIGLWNDVWPDLAQTRVESAAWYARLSGVWLVELEGERAVAGAFVVCEPHLPEGVAGSAVVVRADRRGTGLGTALLGATRERAAGLGVATLRATVRVDLADADGSGHAALAWAGRRGFAEIGRELLLARDLGGELPAADPPPGLTITTWAERPELAPQLHAIARESVPDIPGEEDVVLPDLATWLADDMSGPNDRPEGVIVALAGDEAVGYAKFHLPLGRPGIAVHDLTAVRRAWRGRGVAGALKCAQLAWAAERGYRRIETANEERNAPIRALNERFGYRPAASLVRLQGPVAT